uniref:Uncharacterized protein n=1 Tax=Oryza glumipatula TaxID=40148 RepID=A0A0E0AR78_9ORYZ
MRMWSMRGGCRKPRARNRSAVQHLFNATNQRKIRHRGGASDFQMGADWKETLPMNMAW